MQKAGLRQPVYDPRPFAIGVSAAPAHAEYVAAGEGSRFPGFPEDAFCAATLQGKISVWTPAAERLSGYAPAEVLGRSFSVLIPRDLDADVSAMFERVSEGASVALPFALFPRKDGSRIQVAVRLSPLRDEAGIITGVGVVFRDISEEFCAWEEKSRTVRMRALETVAGSVATELSQIMTALIAGAYGVRGGAPEDGLAQIDGAAARMRTLKRDLAAFAGREPLNPGRIAVDHMLANLTRVLEAAAGPDVQLDILRGAPGATIYADSSQLGQAILHLVGSARDATGGRGNLIVESTVEDSRWPSGSKSRVYAVIRVTEMSSRLDLRARKRVFEPCLGVNGGSGLALAAAYGIVRHSGGHITVESTPGKGTTYAIYLPASHGPQQRTPPRGSHVFSSDP